MSELFDTVQRLVNSGEVRASDHGFDELSEDRISVRDAVRGIGKATLVEE